MRRLILLLFLTGAAAAQTFDAAGLRSAALREIADANIPGAAVAVVRGDRVIFAEGFGTADIETDAPVTPDMLFRLGSTTKMFTAAAFLTVALEHHAGLDDPVGKYVPGLAPKVAAVTANQFLSHTAGLRDSAPMYGPHDERALGEGIRGWKDDWLFTEPGRIYSYSNPGYWLAGYAAEVLAGKPYADVLAERILEPLGMRRSTLRPLMAMTWPLAQGHQMTGRGKPAVVRPAGDNAQAWPAGSLFSSAAELARFVIAFLNDGRIDERQALDPAVIALMSAPHAHPPDSAKAYGYGLSLTEDRGIALLEHGGSRLGYGSHIRMAPALRVGIIVVTNRSGASLPKTIERATEMLLPLGPKTAAAARTAITMDEPEMARYAGIYTSGDSRVELLMHDGRLYSRIDREMAPVTKLGEHRFAVEAGRGFLLVANAGGEIEYLCIGGRALRKTK